MSTRFIFVLGLILVILVMVLYSAVRRGHSAAVVMFTMLSVFYAFIIAMLIGLPQKVPVLAINDTEITLGHTTAGDLMKDGFNIYIEQNYVPGLDYEEILSSGSFKKYPADKSVYMEKGYKINYAPYPLVKDDIVIGYIGLFGDEKKEIVHDDCKIVRVVLSEESVKAIRRNFVSCKLNGLELLAPLKPEEVKKTFGSKLWSSPVSPADITELYYGIRWASPWEAVNHLFWDEYSSWIHFGENNNMTKFEISTNVARDIR